MSEKQNVSISSTKGKGPAIADPATQPTSTIVDKPASAGESATVASAEADKSAKADAQDPDVDEVFLIAGEIEKILKGKSNKTCMKVLSMIGSLHEVRCIRPDRPIGQSTAGTTKAAPPAKKPKKGQPTPPAAWKQTDDYRRLKASRDSKITILKSLTTDEEKTSHLADLKEIERQLKALKQGPSVGNH
jgi:hypothetical protein